MSRWLRLGGVGEVGIIGRVEKLIRPVLGMVLMSLSAVFFSLMSLSIHLLSGENFSSFEIILIRGIALLILTNAMIWGKGSTVHEKFGRKEMRGLLVIRSLVGTIALNSFVYAFANMSLSDATCIVFLAPAITAVMAHFVLGERARPADIAAITCSFVGVVLIARPVFLFGGGDTSESSSSSSCSSSSSSSSSPSASPLSLFVSSSSSGYLSTSSFSGSSGSSESSESSSGSASATAPPGDTLAILSAFSAAFASATVNVLVRKLKGVHGLVIVNYFAFISTMITVVLSISIFGPSTMGTSPVSGRAWAAIFLVGISGWLGQICKTRGLQTENAGAAAMMRNLDLPFSFIWQVLFLHDEPVSPWTVLGAIIIVSSSLTMGIRKWRRGKINPAEVARDVASGDVNSDNDEGIDDDVGDGIDGIALNKLQMEDDGLLIYKDESSSLPSSSVSPSDSSTSSVMSRGSSREPSKEEGDVHLDFSSFGMGNGVANINNDDSV